MTNIFRWACVQTAVATLSVGLAACGAAPEEGGEDVGQQGEAITNGKIVPDNAGAPDTSVVRLQFLNASTCSGIKVSSFRFLTARHCVDLNWPLVGGQLRMTNEIDGRTYPYDLTIKSVKAHPTGWFAQSLFSLYVDLLIVQVQESTPNVPSYLAYRKSRVSNSETGALTAYGQDDNVPNRNGWKQYGWFEFDPTPGGDPGWPEVMLFSLPRTGKAVINNGDSGGPIFTRNSSNVWEVAGVASGGKSYFARVGAAYKWLLDPRVNVTQDGAKGFLLHQKSNKPATSMGSAVGSVAALQHWDARNHASGTDAQYWELDETSTGHYRFINTQSGRCLHNFGSTVSQQTCSTSSSQTWTLSSVPPSPIFIQEFRTIKSDRNGRCLTAASTDIGTTLSAATCSATDDKQRWLWTN